VGSNKKYGSPEPQTADVYNILACIKKEFGYDAGIYVVAVHQPFLTVVCEVGRMVDGELQPICACEERVAVSAPNLTGALYRTGLKAYWAANGFYANEMLLPPDDLPF
jgi:hypothetical protein